MYHVVIMLILLSAATAFGSTCIDCHTNEAVMKKLVVFKAPSGEEGVG